MTISRVTPGKQLKGIPARAWNLMAKTADEYGREGLPTGDRLGGKFGQHALRVQVKNDSGDQMNAFSPYQAAYATGEVLTITGYEYAVSRSPVLSLADQDSPVENAYIAIPQEPIPVGEIGVAVVGGVCLCEVSIANETDRFADLADSAGFQFARSGRAGRIRILQKSAAMVGAEVVGVCLVDLSQRVTADAVYALANDAPSPTGYYAGDGRVYSITIASGATDASMTLPIPGGAFYDIDFRIGGYASSYTTTGQVRVKLKLYASGGSLLAELTADGGTGVPRAVARTASIDAALFNFNEQFSYRRGVPIAAMDPVLKVELESLYGADVTVIGHCSLVARVADSRLEYP